MANTVSIHVLGTFMITSHGKNIEKMITRSKKSLALFELLILARGSRVDNERLYEALWPTERSVNPESALKTMISRLRVILKEMDPALADCIKTGSGSAAFEPGPDVSVDLYEFEKHLRRIGRSAPCTEENYKSFATALDWYSGDFKLPVDLRNAVTERQTRLLREDYCSVLYRYLHYLASTEDNE